MFDSLAMINPEGILIVGAVVLLLFGGKKIPELMRGAGQGLGEFRKGLEDGQRTFHQAARTEAEKPAEPVAPVIPVAVEPAPVSTSGAAAPTTAGTPTA